MEARPDFKNMSAKKKLEYVWDYYKFHIGGILVLAITLCSIIHHYATLKDSVLDMIFMNAQNTYENSYGLDEFFTMQGFDASTQEITVTTSLSFALTEDSYQVEYYTVQTLSAMFAVGDVDIFAAPWQLYDEYAAAGYVADLRTVFTEDELSLYEDKVLYTTSTETGETMPCGFDFSDNRFLQEYKYYTDNCHMGIPANADDAELAKEFLLYLLNYHN